MYTEVCTKAFSGRYQVNHYTVRSMFYKYILVYKTTRSNSSNSLKIDAAKQKLDDGSIFKMLFRVTIGSNLI